METRHIKTVEGPTYKGYKIEYDVVRNEDGDQVWYAVATKSGARTLETSGGDTASRESLAFNNIKRKIEKATLSASDNGPFDNHQTDPAKLRIEALKDMGVL